MRGREAWVQFIVGSPVDGGHWNSDSAETLPVLFAVQYALDRYQDEAGSYEVKENSSFHPCLTTTTTASNAVRPNYVPPHNIKLAAGPLDQF